MGIDGAEGKANLGNLLRSERWRSSEARLPLPIGSDAAGEPMVVDLAEVPHLMVGGGEGLGRSEFIKASIASLMSRLGPKELRVVMVASRPAEFEALQSQPYLVFPVVSAAIQQEVALRWVVKEMEARFKALGEAGVRNIVEFNRRARTAPPGGDGVREKLAYLVVILHEFGDLRKAVPGATDMDIAGLAAMGTSAGIHCVVGLSGAALREAPRTVTDFLRGRIALACASAEDSRRIVGCAGAEELKGTADLLYRAPGGTTAIRAHAASASRAEMDAALKQGVARAGTVRGAGLLHPRPKGSPAEWHLWEEELVQACIQVIRSKGRASIPALQSCLRLRYSVAATIMQELERRGVVGASKSGVAWEDREVPVNQGPGA